jgi:uncharacterized protein (TIGR03437 family)
MISLLAVSMCVVSAADYTTYIGDAFTYTVTAMTTDSSGNTYVTGSRSLGSATGLFVTKIDPLGGVTLLAATDLSLLPPANFTAVAQPVGSVGQPNSANAIAVDSSGNVFIAGVTAAQEFPLVNALQNSPAINNQSTGFLMKFAPNGDVVFSTYLGGTKGSSAMNGVAVDAQGNAYVTGTTLASDYPSTPGLPADPASSGSISLISAAWFAKISGDGSKILYAGGVSSSGHACGAGSTCFLSGIATGGVSIAVDPVGNAYLAGNTYGTLSGTAGALVANGIGAFVAKINAAGNGLAYLTLLGTANNLPGGGGGPAPDSSPGNLISAIAVDSAGDAYIAGETNDPNFPATPGSFQSSLPGGAGTNQFAPAPFSAFVAKLNPTGSAMVWASYLGGDSYNDARNLAVDANGDVWVSGTTNSTNFVASLVVPDGSEFLTEFNPTGSALLYSARLPTNSAAAALVIDSSGSIHTAGGTGIVSSFSPASAPGVTTAPVIFGVTNSAGGVISGRVVPGELISISGLNLGPAAGATAQVNSAGFVPTSLAGVEMTINGTLAPLLYVSAMQINAVAPVELTPGSAVTLRLVTNNVAAPDFRVEVDAAAPEVFPAALNQDGTVNSPSNPAAAGSYVTVWATGTGVTYGADGQITQTAGNQCGCLVSYAAIADGPTPLLNTNVRVAYAGAAPGLVNGVIQINFQVMGGQSGYYLTAGGQNSNIFSIAVAGMD